VAVVDMVEVTMVDQEDSLDNSSHGRKNFTVIKLVYKINVVFDLIE